jgi:hypothetical protein
MRSGVFPDRCRTTLTVNNSRGRKRWRWRTTIRFLQTEAQAAKESTYDSIHINTMTKVHVWYTLDGESPAKVKVQDDADVDDLRNAVKEKWPELKDIAAARLKVYAAGADPNTDDHLDPGDLLKDVANDTTSKNALIVVAQRADLLNSFNRGDVAVAVPPVAVTVAPPSTPRSRDISNQVAAVFEGEGNMYLDNNFQSVLPQCEFSKFKNREIDDGNFALEMDSFSYMTKDTLQSPEENQGLGIYVVRPQGLPKKKPVAAPKKQLGSSPGAITANLVRIADKYVIGESYSGPHEDKMEGKVEELEVKLQKMRDRHANRSGGPVTDVTSLFGAAILSFTCHSLPRRKQSKRCMQAVFGKLSSQVTPILWRLAQAERFFVAVLSTNDAANTCALREIASGMQNVELSVEALAPQLTTIIERLDTLQGLQGKSLSGNESAAEGLHNYEYR